MRKELRLANGSVIPQLALGTFKDTSSKITDAVRIALKAGYRHFDLAYVYNNEKLVGDAFMSCLSSGELDRQSLFITNKLPCSYHKPERAHKVLKKQLESCQCDYFDLYLVHWPMAFKDVYNSDDPMPTDKVTGKVIVDEEANIMETWQALIDMKNSGKVKNIGVSNFNEKQLQQLMDAFPNDYPVVNQIEVHPYCPSWALKNNIIVEAYAPMGAADRTWSKSTDPILLKDKSICQIADELGRTPAQVLIGWLLQREIVVIVKSCTQSRIEENITCISLQPIPSSSINKINEMKTRFRYYQIEAFLEHPNYPYEIWKQ